MWWNWKQRNNGNRAKLEICACDIASVVAAKRGGADRVEICSALDEGGVTPSAGFIAAAVKSGIRVHVLIRPRPGDFIYSAEEVDVMCSDIEIAKRLGAQGVVIGALTAAGEVDVEACRRMMASAEGMTVTFHRAFDRCSDMLKALQAVIDLGCDCLLTSGQEATAVKGAETLRRLNCVAEGRITLIAAAGVTSSNVAKILKRSGVSEVHASAKHRVASTGMATSGVKMGSASDEDSIVTTDQNEVEAIVKRLK